VLRYILINHTASRNDAAFTDRNSLEDDRIESYPGIIPNMDRRRGNRADEGWVSMANDFRKVPMSLLGIQGMTVRIMDIDVVGNQYPIADPYMSGRPYPRPLSDITPLADVYLTSMTEGEKFSCNR
jgi:hypothetical protein